jgi:hypothetical protein
MVPWATARGFTADANGAVEAGSAQLTALIGGSMAPAPSAIPAADRPNGLRERKSPKAEADHPEDRTPTHHEGEWLSAI